jgi:predicted RNase H-like HicB family nuclease
VTGKLLASLLTPWHFSPRYADAMEPMTYHVQADWDGEAGVWVATSEDVPGLATEAETIKRLTDRLRTIIPELLVANGLIPRDSHDRAIT